MDRMHQWDAAIRAEYYLLTNHPTRRLCYECSVLVLALTGSMEKGSGQQGFGGSPVSLQSEAIGRCCGASGVRGFVAARHG
jgi:hypothetical protein